MKPLLRGFLLSLFIWIKIIYIYIFIALAAGFIASVLAEVYGRDAPFLFWICLIFPFAIFALLILGEDKEALQLEKLKQQRQKQANEYKECPYCAELIKKKAIVCKHCGRDITTKEIEM